MVLVNRGADSSVPTIAAGYRTALRELLELLYDNGHRSLVFLAGAPQSASNAARLAALEEFRAALSGRPASTSYPAG